MICHCNRVSLSDQLHLASSLAYCDDIIQALRSREEVPRDAAKWLFNTMNICSYSDKSTGVIANFLLSKDSDLFVDVVEVSRRVNLKPPVLRRVDWDLMLCGVELYRRELLDR